MEEEAIDVAAPPPGQRKPLEHLPFKFTGGAGEYFRIWIVNVLLSVLTLGIYSAWAKVRTKTYFYRHTWVDDTSFDYHADPRRILIGRVIVGSFFAALFTSQFYSLMVYGVLLCLLFLMVPWITIKALSFNARNSSYRNVRFSFAGRLSEAFWVQVGLPLLSVLTLGLLSPYADCRFRRFLAENHRYGTRRFAFDAPALSFYWMYLRAMALGIVGVLGATAVMVVVVMVAGAGSRPGTSAPDDQLILLPVIIIYLSMLVPGAYIRATSANLFYNHSALDEGRFRSQQRPLALFWIYLSNLVAIFCSLGLLVPWAKVRLARYRAQCLSLHPAGSLTVLADREQQDQAALGDAAADFGDFDFGL